MGIPQAIHSVGDNTSPAERLRIEWGESLAEHLAMSGVTRKQFQHMLAEAGHEVTKQTIGMWLTGKTSPRPYMQGVIASVLRVPVRRLFPIEAQ